LTLPPTAAGRRADRYSDGTYLRENPSWHVDDSSWKAGHVLEMLGRHDIRPLRVCEVGCGAGEVLRQTHMRLAAGARSVGYDISPQALALAAPRATDRLEFRLGEPSDTSDAYDVLLLIDVIEHVEDYMAFLRRLNGRSTYTVLHVPLDLSVQIVARPSQLLGKRRALGHVHYFTKELALAAIGEAGYDVVDWFYTPGGVDLPGSALSVLARRPRQLLAAVSPDAAARLLGGYSLLVLAQTARTPN
jgi:SAM-dependent methyltransferase